jgi:NADP-dependent 3-hydroxy acid dehydrogenase YdfG
VITGAASGIGRATAHAAAAAGMRVVLADIEAEPLRRAEAELSGRGARVSARDVRSGAELGELAELTLRTHGRVDLVHNNAGVILLRELPEFTLADWRWVLDVNLIGVINGVHAFLPILTEQDEGHIVNTASIAGLTPWPGCAPYAVSKYGIVGLSEVLYAELRQRGSSVGVSVVCPAATATALAGAVRNRAEASASQRAEAREEPRIDGMDPADVARAILEAVRERRFWVLTHKDELAAVDERHRALMAETNPPAVVSAA